MQIKQHRTRSIRGICCVNTSSGQVPDQPAVYRSKQQFAGLSSLTRSRHMIQYPADFGSGEVCVYDQAGAFPDEISVSGGFDLIANGGRSAILPDDSRVNGMAGLAIPDHGSLPLVGDANRFYGIG